MTQWLQSLALGAEGSGFEFQLHSSLSQAEQAFLSASGRISGDDAPAWCLVPGDGQCIPVAVMK